MKFNFECTNAEWRVLQGIFFGVMAGVMLLCYMAFIHEEEIYITFEANIGEVCAQHGYSKD